MSRIRRLPAWAIGQVRDTALQTPIADSKIAKGLYDRTSRFLSPDSPIWIDFRGMDLYIDPNDQIGWEIYRGKWEPDVFEIIESNLGEGDIAFDVGGHFGVYTLFMRQQVGPSGSVVVFEPEPRNADFLSKTIERNGFDNIHIVRAAVSSESGSVTFRSVEQSSLSTTYTEPSTFDEYDEESIEVEALSLDEYLEDNEISSIGFMKIDIQGAEVEAIQGLIDHLSSVETIYIEIHSVLSDAELETLFSTLNQYGSVYTEKEREYIDSYERLRESNIVWHRTSSDL